jgi:hypothetical protein
VYHINTCDIEDLERAKLETCLVAQDAVNGGKVGHAFRCDLQRFCGASQKAYGFVDGIHSKDYGRACLAF